MDGPALSLLSTALVTSAVTLVLCRWWYSRRIAALRQRLDKAEQARQSAYERSSQARAEIAQLSEAIAELQRRHHISLDTQRKRLQAGRAAPPEAAAAPPANGFADTQPL